MGRSTTRPSRIRAARPMAAGARVSRAAPRTAGFRSPPLWARVARTVTVIRMGATAMSWASRMEKVARPAVPCSRLRSASTGMTTAVEDRARPMPSTMAETKVWPVSMNPAAITAVARAIWLRPRPNTNRRMDFSRSHDSSSPIMNSRKATPSSDNWAIWSRSSSVSQPSQASQGASSANRPSPSGPSSTPAARKPSTGLILMRLNRGTTTPAAARKTSRSLYSDASPWGGAIRRAYSSPQPWRNPRRSWTRRRS